MDHPLAAGQPRLVPLGRGLLLARDAGLLEVCPAPRLGEDAVLLHLLVEPLQGALQSLVLADNDLGHIAPSLRLGINYLRDFIILLSLSAVKVKSHQHLRRRQGALVAVRDTLAGRLHEVPEQRMQAVGARFELGVELAAQHPGMIGDLADLHQPPVG